MNFLRRLFYSARQHGPKDNRTNFSAPEPVMEKPPPVQRIHVHHYIHQVSNRSQRRQEERSVSRRASSIAMSHRSFSECSRVDVSSDGSSQAGTEIFEDITPGADVSHGVSAWTQSVLPLSADLGLAGIDITGRHSATAGSLPNTRKDASLSSKEPVAAGRRTRASLRERPPYTPLKDGMTIGSIPSECSSSRGSRVYLSASTPPSSVIPQDQDPKLPEDLVSVKNLEIQNPISISTFMQILQSYTRLQRLSVRIEKSSDLDLTSRPLASVVVAKNLVDLKIITATETKPLLDSFKAPNLRMFHFEWDPKDRLAPMPKNSDIGLHQFLKESSCILHSLSLVGLFPDESHLVECLELGELSQLQALLVRDDNSQPYYTNTSGRLITGKTLSALTADEDHFLCPHLTRLEISPCFAEDGQLGRMISTRMNLLQNQQQFYLSFSHHGEPSRPLDDFLLSQIPREQIAIVDERPCRTAL